MRKIKTLLKWMVIVDGSIALINSLGTAVFLFIRGALHPTSFLRLLLLALMFEGLIIALIGCLSFFGFEKYRILLGGEYKSEQQKVNSEDREEDKQKPDIRLLILSAGISLFFVSFAYFSSAF